MGAKVEEFYCTSDTCVAALRTRFKSPEYALFEQVANSTGAASRRWADAVALGIWPSRGLSLHGFEIKVSRSDWKKELATPAKSEPVQKYCDYWHIVTPRGLVDPSDLPPTWGLLEVTPKKTLVTRVKAPPLEPVPVTRHFLAALLRRHFEAWDAALRAARDEGYKKGAENGNGEIVARLTADRKHHEALREQVHEYEKASGLKIEFGWQHEEMGEAVRLLMDKRHRTDVLDMLKNDARAYERRLSDLQADISLLEAVRTAETE